MRTVRVLFLIVIAASGCATQGSSSGLGERRTTAKPAASESARPAATPVTKRANFTAKNNPTTAAGRGEPSLDEADRPAAWVFVDGKSGRFTEREGRRLIQWTIDAPVDSSPTFRVEGFDPLLGDARDFKCILRSLDNTEGTAFVYKIVANEGTFVSGADYSLLDPGENFTIRNDLTGDIVREIAPLAPGTYAIAAGLKNSQTKKEAAAVTYFTVGETR
jgi:hypothetical protein